MKAKMHGLFKNDLFILLMNAVFAYTAFTMVIIVTLQTPPEALLNTNMAQIIMIFDEDPLPVVNRARIRPSQLPAYPRGNQETPAQSLHAYSSQMGHTAQSVHAVADQRQIEIVPTGLPPGQY